MRNRFSILSLSGGGFRGLYTAAVLAALEEKSGKPLASSFDLIAGTSIGGIIALGLAAEIPATKIRDAMAKNGASIFSNRPAPTGILGSLWDMRRNILRSKYQAEGLRGTINELFGKNVRIGDLRHRVLVPTVNLTKGRPQIFKTPHHPNFRTDLHRSVVEVALATSAAPTYFPIAEVGDALYADGGLFANAPDLLAIHEATYFLGQKEEYLDLLSVGTTTAQFSFAHANGRNLGILGWVLNQRLISVMIGAQQQSVHDIVRHRLGDRYFRLDTVQSSAQEQHVGLDIASANAQRTLLGLAQSTVQEAISDPRFVRFASHKAPNAKFYLEGK